MAIWPPAPIPAEHPWTCEADFRLSACPRHAGRMDRRRYQCLTPTFKWMAPVSGVVCPPSDTWRTEVGAVRNNGKKRKGDTKSAIQSREEEKNPETNLG